MCSAQVQLGAARSMTVHMNWRGVPLLWFKVIKAQRRGQLQGKHTGLNVCTVSTNSSTEASTGRNGPGMYAESTPPCGHNINCLILSPVIKDLFAPYVDAGLK